MNINPISTKYEINPSTVLITALTLLAPNGFDLLIVATPLDSRKEICKTPASSQLLPRMENTRTNPV
jgi:hypothetical protein